MNPWVQYFENAWTLYPWCLMSKRSFLFIVSMMSISWASRCSILSLRLSQHCPSVQAISPSGAKLASLNSMLLLRSPLDGHTFHFYKDAQWTDPRAKNHHENLLVPNKRRLNTITLNVLGSEITASTITGNGQSSPVYPNPFVRYLALRVLIKKLQQATEKTK